VRTVKADRKDALTDVKDAFADFRKDRANFKDLVVVG